MPAAWRFKRGGGDAVGEVFAVGADARERPLGLLGGRVAVPRGTRRLRYVYSLEDAVARGGQRFDTGAGGEGVYMVGGTAYLLRPDEVPGQRSVEVAFRGEVLVPWALDAGGVARIEGRDLWDPGFHTFGARPQRIELQGGAFELAVLPSQQRPSDAALEAWISQAGRELLTIRPRLPHTRVPVTLVPLPGARQASPFGQVLWSRPPSLALYVGGAATDRELASDWVAVHEALHLAHPRFRPGVPWLSEGLATYYQGVTRLRSGRMTPEAIWGHLLRGVRGGRRESGGRSLAECSERMHELHCYRAVYWGGALFLLELDLELRRASGGRHTLDEVLQRLLARGPSSSLASFAQEVDAVAGAPLYAEVAARHLEAPALHGAAALLEELGIEAGAEGAHLRPAARSAELEALGQPR